MNVDTMTLPDGNSLSASPENRRRAFDLWQLNNSGKPERLDDELDVSQDLIDIGKP